MYIYTHIHIYVYSPWGHKKSNMTEQLNTHIFMYVYIYTCMNFFWPYHMACGFIVLQKGMNPVSQP